MTTPTRTPYGGGAIGSLCADHSPHRRPDERIARCVAEALGDARTVLDVGAVAADLPFGDGEFDASMTLFGVHRWSDVPAGLREMRRVTRGPVVILTCDPAVVRDFWLHRYAPEVLDIEALRHPTVEELASALGGCGTVRTVPIPLDCTGGFDEAYYGRPPGGFGLELRGRPVREHFDTTLRAALESGAWDEEFGHLRSRPTYEGSLVIVRATP
ncbi:methyltransferase domain-containing protein [Streptomyces virginiae]|uniref:class I SAM-dependent methyltransferase n=1 Tax=Streptomyces virginiae TaxID=1961 RepID=UPI002DDA2A4B|nr:methyltransferase domain-containing protein [Streptomyces virginiae]WSC81516.1 SAM-dependent methyltransferase [Streptomyces virginiae]